MKTSSFLTITLRFSFMHFIATTVLHLYYQSICLLYNVNCMFNVKYNGRANSRLYHKDKYNVTVMENEVKWSEIEKYIYCILEKYKINVNNTEI